MIALIFSQFHADYFHGNFVKMITLLLSATLSVTAAAKLGFDARYKDIFKIYLFLFTLLVSS